MAEKKLVLKTARERYIWARGFAWGAMDEQSKAKRLAAMNQEPSSQPRSAVTTCYARPREIVPEAPAEQGVMPAVLLDKLGEYEDKVLACQEELGEGMPRSYYAGMRMAYQIAQETVVAWFDGGLE